MASTASRYKKQLSLLLDNGVISEELYRHFIIRGLKVVSPSNDFGLDYLGKILPEIVIGASSDYVSKMKVPYQATSYVAARTKESGKAVYIYKIPHKPGGGVLSLTGGIRKLGDSIFASTHRILLGTKAMMISADNLVVNKEHIWNWQFFGNAIKESNPNIYEDLIKLREKVVTNSMFHQIVVARSDKTFRRLKFANLCQKNQIRILDPKNGIKVVFLTNESGYEYASRFLPESDLIHYVITGKEFDMYLAMIQIRRLYGIDMILNDGGRIMSNSVRDLGLLGEERVTLEPYPGDQFVPQRDKIDSKNVLGIEGTGIDGGEIKNAIKVHSTRIRDELANVYLYRLDEKLCT
ncbi:MAG: hypothetical protein QOK68_03185 [Nitrososphaeraceae archaeon]|jgi:hypothetical protein|nr:hypothetical protein [Nitrososphaeraceae archaeon]